MIKQADVIFDRVLEVDSCFDIGSRRLRRSRSQITDIGGRFCIELDHYSSSPIRPSSVSISLMLGKAGVERLGALAP